MARILHIEDDPKNRLLVRKLLASHGHDVIDAETGLEGIRLAEAKLPDLVLIDTNIPDLDGYEVTLRLRGTPSLRRVPIVAITAEGDRETSLAVGADGFIQKPIDASRFPSTIERFLEGFREKGAESGDARLRERSQRIVARLEDKVVALQEANARLEQVARLRREFLQNMSHELATPLTPIVGYLTLLLNDELGELTPLQRKCLKQVMDSTGRLRLLIDTLLDVSALETGRMPFRDRDYDFGEVVAKAVQSMQHGAQGRGITLHVRGSSGPLPGFGDPIRIERAVVHVLENAVKFSADGGHVAIEAGREGPFYVCWVGDGGPGVPGAELARIFEPFYQIDGSATRSHGGVGLGLAFVRRVAEAHGGRVEVKSPPERVIAGQQLSGTAVGVYFLPRRPL